MKMILNKAKKFIKKNDTRIMAICGMILQTSGFASAIWLSPKGQKKLKDVMDSDEFKKATKGKKIKMIFPIVLKYYVPSTALFVTGSALDIAAFKKSDTRLTAAIAAVGASQIRYDKLKEEVQKELGKTKTANIEKEAVKSELQEKPEIKNINTEMVESFWFVDYETQKPFTSTMREIMDAKVKVIKYSQYEEWTSLAEFYSYIDGMSKIPPILEDIGWNMGDEVEIYFTPFQNENGICITAIQTNARRREEYRYS